MRTELLNDSIVVESMGGDTIEVEVSAKEGTNLDKLLEMILLQSEVLELRANPDRTAEGTVIEAQLDKGRGPVATVLVQKGTMKVRRHSGRWVGMGPCPRHARRKTATPR